MERIAALLRAVVIAAAVVLVVSTLGEVVMIAFAAVLVAVLLWDAAARLGRLAGIGTGWGLLAVVLLLAASIVGLGWRFGPNLAHQAAELQGTASQQLAALRSHTQETDWGRSLLERLPFGNGATGGGPAASAPGVGGGLGTVIPHLPGFAAGALWSVLGVFGTVGVILVAALYMAAAPAPYVRGLTHLMPRAWRPETLRVMGRIGQDLWGADRAAHRHAGHRRAVRCGAVASGDAGVHPGG